MASNFALVKMQLFFEAALLLTTLVIRALNSGSMSSHDTRVADSTLKGKTVKTPSFCTYSHTCAINRLRKRIAVHVYSIDRASSLLHNRSIVARSIGDCAIDRLVRKR